MEEINQKINENKCKIKQLNLKLSQTEDVNQKNYINSEIQSVQLTIITLYELIQEISNKEKEKIKKEETKEIKEPSQKDTKIEGKNSKAKKTFVKKRKIKWKTLIR